MLHVLFMSSSCPPKALPLVAAPGTQGHDTRLGRREGGSPLPSPKGDMRTQHRAPARYYQCGNLVRASMLNVTELPRTSLQARGHLEDRQHVASQCFPIAASRQLRSREGVFPA